MIAYLAGVLGMYGAIELHGVHKLMRLNPVKADTIARHSQPVYTKLIQYWQPEAASLLTPCE